MLEWRVKLAKLLWLLTATGASLGMWGIIALSGKWHPAATAAACVTGLIGWVIIWYFLTRLGGDD